MIDPLSFLWIIGTIIVASLFAVLMDYYIHPRK